MTTMVEKVALAISAAISEQTSPRAFDAAFQPLNTVPIARAALEAMKEPMEEMAEAGEELLDWGALFETAYRAAIDVAFKEGEGE